MHLSDKKLLNQSTFIFMKSTFFVYIDLFYLTLFPGNILGNVKVRISDPWEKSAAINIFETLFWL